MKRHSRSDDLYFQAEVFTNYLVGHPVTKAAQQQYVEAISYNSPAVDKQDAKLLSLLSRYPKLLSFIDAGLTLRKPYSEVRRRIYMMLAILEASPDYHEDFLPQQRTLAYIPYLGYKAFLSIMKLLIGFVVVRTVS